MFYNINSIKKKFQYYSIKLEVFDNCITFNYYVAVAALL